MELLSFLGIQGVQQLGIKFYDITTLNAIFVFKLNYMKKSVILGNTPLRSSFNTWRSDKMAGILKCIFLRKKCLHFDWDLTDFFPLTVGWKYFTPTPKLIMTYFTETSLGLDELAIDISVTGDDSVDN